MLDLDESYLAWTSQAMCFLSQLCKEAGGIQVDVSCESAIRRDLFWDVTICISVGPVPTLEGTQRLLEPVSKTTLNFWAGLPIVISP